jgi:hypothetical protein
LSFSDFIQEGGRTGRIGEGEVYAISIKTEELGQTPDISASLVRAVMLEDIKPLERKGYTELANIDLLRAAIA